MKSITAYGCSITAGVGLPPRSAWPHQLAHIMGIKRVHNRGIPGASGKQILHEILHDSTEVDQVVVLWPQFARTGFHHADGWIKILPNQGEHYYREFYSESDHRFQAHMHITLAHHHLHRLGCAQHHFTWEYNTYQLEQPLWNPVKLHPIQFDYMTLPLASDGVHPGVEAHREVARFMHHIIQM